MPRPEDIVVGIGLSGTATAEGAAAFLNQVLTSAKIDRARIRALATIDRRADNAILAQLAVELGVPARTFSAERLERETPRLRNPSASLFARIGCHGVAEAAALAEAGEAARLIVEKTPGPVSLSQSRHPRARFDQPVKYCWTFACRYAKPAGKQTDEGNDAQGHIRYRSGR